MGVDEGNLLSVMGVEWYILITRQVAVIASKSSRIEL